MTRIVMALGWVANLPAAAVGPIFTKELRVSSRRRRNYVLRSVYLAVLTLFVALVWSITVRWEARGTYAHRVTMMSEAGRIITCCIVWFLFCAAQLLVVILLSTSISEEIYGRTLGVLMSTPIRSFQIVVGKLLSKMLQLVVLLAASLPLLAIVRVLGGVPWEFILAGLSITLCTAVLLASITMFFSIFLRRAYASILMTMGFGLVMYLATWLIPMLAIRAFHAFSRELLMGLLTIMLHYNPFAALMVCTMELVEPRAMAALPYFSWPINCLVSLGLAALVLALCVKLVRRAALRQALGGSFGPSGRGLARVGGAPAMPQQPVAPAGTDPARPPEAAPVAPAWPAPIVLTPVTPVRIARIRHVGGSPVVWKELHSPWLRRKVLGGVLLGLGGLILLAIYGLIAVDDGFDDRGVHAVMLVIFVGLAALCTAVLAATNITAEKEAATWEILLCTPLTNQQILWGKAVGILRRCLPAWLVPLGHVAFFILQGVGHSPRSALLVNWRGVVHPILPPHLMLVVASIVLPLAGAGLYFGTRFRRTTTAVVLNVAFALTIWGAVPGLLALCAEAVPGPLRTDLRHATECSLVVNPIVQTGVVTNEESGRHRARQALRELSYNWPGFDTNAGETTVLLACTAVGHGVLGAVFAFLALRRIRRHPK